MKNTQQIILLLLISIVLASCKYDEGPMISFRTVENRVAKEHSVVEFTKNDMDKTQELIDSVGKDWKFLSYYQTSLLDHNMRIYPSTNQLNDGYYDILSNKKNIEIKIYGSIYGYSYIGIEPFKEDVVTTWEIERLTKDEMWLSCTYNNADYYLKLKANEN